MLEDEEDDLDPLCPKIPVSIEERRNLCKPWRRAIIIKLLGRTVGYRYLYARLTKIWNPSSNFELIDLQKEFFVVRFAEKSDYHKVLFDGPSMVLGHYLTGQQWKPEFRPLEESIKKIVVWVRIPDLPIEYYDKHFLWRARNRVGKTLKVDMHTVKENHNGGEMYTTERGRFARISVEINLNKKTRS